MPRRAKNKQAPAVSIVPGANFITPAPESAPAPAPIVAQNTTTIAPVITTNTPSLHDTAPTFVSAFEAYRDLFADTCSPDNTMVSTATKAESVESSIHSSEFDTAIEIVPTIYPFPAPASEAPVLDHFGLTWPLHVPKALAECQLLGPGGSEVDCPLLTTPLQISHLIDILYLATHPPTLSSISPGGEPFPTLFLDLEGTKLSRHGSISILQICVQRELPTAYPVDKNAGGEEHGWPEEGWGGVWPKGTFQSVDEFATKWAKVNYPSKEVREKQERDKERKKAGEVYLIDVHTLGASAFTTVGIEIPNVTLKSILEDAQVPKVFFDVRNDSNALYFLFGIKLAGIHDLQVMQAATKRGSFILGLGKCIADILHVPDRKVHRSTEPFIDSALNDNEIKAVTSVSTRGKSLFAPELGGTYSVFTDRPLSKSIIHYCITDVVLMPAIYARLRHSFVTWDKNNVVKAVDHQGMTVNVGEHVFNMLKVSERRVFLSQLERYDPKSRSKVLNPWQTLSNHNKELDTTSSSRGGRGGLGGGRGYGRGRGRGRGHGRGRGGRGGSEVPSEFIQPQPWDFSEGVEWVKFARPAATVEEW